MTAVVGYRMMCAPNEALLRVTVCKSKTKRPVADGADELVDNILQQNVANVFGTHAA